jgi:hypothetical protein
MMHAVFIDGPIFKYILPYTVKSSIAECEQAAIDIWGEHHWNKIQHYLRAKIVEMKGTNDGYQTL